MKTKPKRKRKAAAAPSESAVYDGSRLLGTITPKDETFVARNTAGKKLGSFATDRLAMKAITDAARALRNERASA